MMDYLLILTLFTFTFTFASSNNNNRLQLRYSWKQIDYKFESQKAKLDAIQSKEFIQQNNVPIGIEIWKNKLFVTVPRRTVGIPSTLNYIDLGEERESPQLIPYPNWKANKLGTGNIVSVYRINVDRCNRLWMVDVGSVVDFNGNGVVYYKAKIQVYDLNSDTLIRQYTLKDEDIETSSQFTNIVVDHDVNCDNTFAYISDLGSYGLVVYSWNANDSWRIKHSYFYPDPLSTNYNIAGINFQWRDGIFGLALSNTNHPYYKTLFFHPLSTNIEFAVSTKYLQNKTIANNSFHAYNVLGSRGTSAQASASAFDEKTGVLFYPLVNKNSIGCWNSRKYGSEYSERTNGIIAKDDVGMVYASDTKVDKVNNLWVITNRLPVAVFSQLDANDVNFRIYRAPVVSAIKGTVCDIK